MTRLKSSFLSFILCLVATVLFSLHIYDFYGVYYGNERGIWDDLPSFCVKTLFILYPVTLFIGFLFFLYAKSGDLFYKITKRLLILNGLLILAVLFYYYIFVRVR